MKKIRKIARKLLREYPVLTAVGGLVLVGPYLTAIGFLLLWILEEPGSEDHEETSE